jgi:hypothetical protein
MTRSSFLFALVATAALPILFPTAAFSQQTGDKKKSPSGEGGSSVRNADQGFSLLQLPEVQEDLDLKQGQKVQVLFLAMEMQKTRLDVKKKLAEILNPRQLQRLKEIRLQVEGPAAISNYEVAAALDLTRDQRAKLETIQNKLASQMTEVIQELKGLTADEREAAKPEIKERLQYLREEFSRKALKVLNPEQLKKFEQMQGKKLKLGGTETRKKESDDSESPPPDGL